MNSSFFSARKKRNHHDNLPFYLIRYGSSRDSSSPYETQNVIENQLTGLTRPTRPTRPVPLAASLTSTDNQLTVVTGPTRPARSTPPRSARRIVNLY